MCECKYNFKSYVTQSLRTRPSVQVAPLIRWNTCQHVCGDKAQRISFQSAALSSTALVFCAAVKGVCSCGRLAPVVGFLPPRHNDRRSRIPSPTLHWAEATEQITDAEMEKHGRRDTVKHSMLFGHLDIKLIVALSALYPENKRAAQLEICHRVCLSEAPRDETTL